MRKLFVYGSLMKGYKLHNILGTSEFLGKGWISGYGMQHMDAFPAAYRDIFNEHYSVQGEIYSVTDKIIDECDRIEGVPHFFYRARITSGSYGEVECYLIPHPRHTNVNWERVMGGIWKGPETESTLVYAPASNVSSESRVSLEGGRPHILTTVTPIGPIVKKAEELALPIDDMGVFPSEVTGWKTEMVENIDEFFG